MACLVSRLVSLWEAMKCETINQRLCRMLLSVHSKASGLAVLWELGQCPLHVRALLHCLAYRHSLASKPSDSRVALAMAEMAVQSSRARSQDLQR